VPWDRSPIDTQSVQTQVWEKTENSVAKIFYQTQTQDKFNFGAKIPETTSKNIFSYQDIQKISQTLVSI